MVYMMPDGQLVQMQPMVPPNPRAPMMPPPVHAPTGAWPGAPHAMAPWPAPGVAPAPAWPGAHAPRAPPPARAWYGAPPPAPPPAPPSAQPPPLRPTAARTNNDRRVGGGGPRARGDGEDAGDPEQLDPPRPSERVHSPGRRRSPATTRRIPSRVVDGPGASARTGIVIEKSLLDE